MMNIITVTYILILLLCLLSNSAAFGLRNCSSNRIHEVSRDGGKATIRYDDKEEISFSGNSDVTIWCEANSAIDECILEQQPLENNKFDPKCNYSYPPSCTYEDRRPQSICHQNKRIAYKGILSNVCQFIIKGIIKEGNNK